MSLLFDQRHDQSWREILRKMPPREVADTLLSPDTYKTMRKIYDFDKLGLNEEVWKKLRPKFKMGAMELYYLAEYAYSEDKSYHRYIEVGSGVGGSMAAYCIGKEANSLPKRTLRNDVTSWIISIDPFIPYQEKKYNGTKTATEGNKDSFWETMKLIGAEHAVRQYRLTSKEGASEFSGGYEADLIFIDGNHSYASVVEDLYLWYPKVGLGGHLLGHDYNTRFPGVIQAVDEFEKKNNLIAHFVPKTTFYYFLKG